LAAAPRFASLHSSSTPLRSRHAFPTRRSSDLPSRVGVQVRQRVRGGLGRAAPRGVEIDVRTDGAGRQERPAPQGDLARYVQQAGDRKSTRLNSSHVKSSYAVFCWKKKKSRIPE